MQAKELLDKVVEILDEGKARNVHVIDVHQKTSITDYFVIASGTSERHVRSLSDQVVEKVNAFQVKPLGIEGARAGEWVLVDLGDVVVHVMLPATREFYQLEKLWEPDFVPKRTMAVG